MLFWRSDGTRLRGLDPMRRMMPMLMPTRGEAVVYYEQIIDATALVAFLDAHNRGDGPKLTPLHCVVAALVRKITAQLDLPATPPDVLARLYAALLLQAAEVRCVDGPAPTGRSMSQRPCAAPRFATVGGKPVLQFAVEEYPHPTLLNRDQHRLYWYQVEVLPHELSSMEGEGLAMLEPATPHHAAHRVEAAQARAEASARVASASA